MAEILGTPLFDQVWEEASQHQALMRQVWAPTPWMLDVFTGPVMRDRDAAMRHWCVARFGEECWPLHGRLGSWQRGGVTIHGWTWFGFATAEQMLLFEQEWPSYPESLRAAATARTRSADGAANSGTGEQ